MGCHTWYRAAVVKDKDVILQIAQRKLNWSVEKGYTSEDHRKMWQYAIDNELCNAVGDLVDICIDENEPSYSQIEGCGWVLYENPNNIALRKYNEQYGTAYEHTWYIPKEHQNLLDTYGDIPRIGGYPENIIRSYDEMIEFMEKGFVDEDGVHHKFYYKYSCEEVDVEEEKERAIAQVKRFFDIYPDGIITFG